MFDLYKPSQPQPLQCDTCNHWHPLRRFPGWRRIPSTCRAHLCREFLLNKDHRDDLMCKECLAKALEAQFGIANIEHICCPVATCRQVWREEYIVRCLGKDGEGMRRRREYKELREIRRVQKRVAGTKGLHVVDREAEEVRNDSVGGGS